MVRTSSRGYRYVSNLLFIIRVLRLTPTFRILAFNDHAQRLSTTTSLPTATDTSVVVTVMTRLADDIDKVVSEAIHVVKSLDGLDGQLLAHLTLWEESHVVTSDMETVRTKLWNLLGGNKVTRVRLAYRETLLRNLDQYHRMSAAHIAATTEVLLAVATDLAELRSKLRASQAGKAHVALPIELLVDSIERGVRRLYQDKLRKESS